MDISGEYRMSVGRQEVWDLLLDAAVLRRCIPGCEELEELADDRYRAKVKTSIGPVKATFLSELQITSKNPPESYRLEGEGKGGAMGFGKGYADVTLTEEDGATLLNYKADFQVGGRLAQLGSRLVVGATRKIADDFFSRLTSDIDENSQRVEPEASATPGPQHWLVPGAVAGLILLAAWWLLS
jgi:carbon monoxide dehydrogenase subunit G